MSTVALTDEYRELALSIRGDHALFHPERLLKATFDVWRACVDDFLEEKRIVIYNGPIADSMASRAMAWTRRRIAIDDDAGNWRDWPNMALCPLLTEECWHTDEIKRWAGLFQGKYVFNPRFRWAQETQPTVIRLRWHRKMGMRRENLMRIIEQRAESFAKPFPGYNLGRIANLRAETVRTLTKAIQ